MGQVRQAQYLIMRRTADAGGREVALVKAGQHGDRNYLGVLARRCLGVFHHRASAAGMDRDDRRFQHVDRLHRCGNGVGNVMQFEIEEDRQPDLGDLMHPVMAMGAKELEAEFQPPDVALYLAGEGFGSIKPRNVEREVDRVRHGSEHILAGFGFKLG